jgi:hypothetical protein
MRSRDGPVEALAWEADVDQRADGLRRCLVLGVVEEEFLARLIGRVPFEDVKVRVAQRLALLCVRIVLVIVVVAICKGPGV